MIHEKFCTKREIRTGAEKKSPEFSQLFFPRDKILPSQKQILCNQVFYCFKLTDRQIATYSYQRSCGWKCSVTSSHLLNLVSISSEEQKPLRRCISPHLLQRPEYWEQQKLRPRGTEEDMSYSSVHPYMQTAISRRKFLQALQCSDHWSVDWDQCWNVLTGSLYSRSAHALANNLCLEAASIRFQLHAEVSFGLSIFYYATFLLCWQGMGIQLYGWWLCRLF